MTGNLPSRLFVTGTDTDAGKTVISALLTAGLDAHYWKPVQSGVREGTDTETVRRLTGLPAERFLPEAYRLMEPLSPHAAALIDGVRIDLDAIRMPNLPADARLVVEGAGGIMVPLNENALMIDLMARLGLPVVLVARSGLGTINHTLLSLAALRQAGIEVCGVVLNGPRNPANRDAVEEYGKVRVLAEVEPLPQLSPATLRETFARVFAQG
ncbi:dethiobiotin synthase [Desulfobaculum xiamenense]|uniref:ATP-dependent dethiobiotin synthetase BioD n=1 Tax=Desulfobaculum xiamenense TaxID=995050 RepID=A0A846QJB0_9BACT|nr:dethiobiotin synthase [Desulfobaculum xiamenense]NJB67157.1 dethiobiotin synthase [Desulfobaculum xiamenense]